MEIFIVSVVIYIVFNVYWSIRTHVQIEKLECRVEKLEYEFAKLERETKFNLPKAGIYVSRWVGSHSNGEYLGKFEEVFMAIVKHLNITRTPDISGSIEFKSKDE
jgi:hypothetical protein